MLKMRTLVVTLAVVCAFGFVLTGCKKETGPAVTTTGAETGAAYRPGVPSATGYAGGIGAATGAIVAQTRDEYIRQVESSLGDWNRRIDSLRTRAAQATSDTRDDVNKLLDNAVDKRADVEKKLADLRRTTNTDWTDTRDSIVSSVRELNDNLSKAEARLTGTTATTRETAAR